MNSRERGRVHVAIYVLNLVAQSDHRGIISDQLRKLAIEERDALVEALDRPLVEKKR